MANCVVCSTEVRDDARFCPSCGAEQPRATQTNPSDDPFIGQTVNRNFKIEKLLGVGGMGKVYKARQLSLDKTVVIKILHDQFRDDPQLVQRFQREARAASRLNHPNSIQVIDFGQDENKVLFMAQEFLEGVDLFTVLRNQGPLPKERCARIMMQVCSALAEAHENNVIHRDLKPENIMVEDRRGQRDFVKVLDFGIAKIQDPDAGGQALTQAGMVCGTPEYMSPEQARGMQLDSRSDLYSLGVLVYQLATGELPFHADSPIGIVTKHILENPVPPRERVPHLNIDPELERIILKAMEKEADTRYQTAGEMGADFERLLYAGGPPSQTGLDAATTTQTGATVVGSASRPAQTAAPSSSSTSVQPATTTSPTPTGITGSSQSAPRVVTQDVDLAPPRASGGGLKWAAIAALVLVLVGGGIAAALLGGGDEPSGDDATAQQPEEPGEKTDPVAAVAPPDEKKPEAVEEPDEKAPEDERPTTTGEGTQAATAKKPPREPQETATEPAEPKQPKVSRSNREKAKALMADAVLDVLSSDPAKSQKAYEDLKLAWKLDPSNPRPLVNIAGYHKMHGRHSEACNAIKTYVNKQRAQLSPEAAASLLKSNCKGDDLPAALR